MNFVRVAFKSYILHLSVLCIISLLFACNSDKKLKANFLINGIDTKDAANITAPDASKNEAIIVKTGETVYLQDLSLPSDQSKSWTWDIDDNGIPEYTTKDCSHVYDLIGSYQIKLCVNDENNCVSKWIIVEEAQPLSGNVATSNSPTVENEQIVKEKKQVAEAQQQENNAKEEAKRLAEAAKIAADNQKKLEQTQLAESKRLEKEQKLAEQKAKIAAQQEAKANDAAEKARLKEEKRIAEAELQKKKQEAAEAQRLAEKQKNEEAKRVAEAQRLAAQKEEEAKRKAAEKKAAEEKLAAQQEAARKAEADRVAAQQELAKKAAEEKKAAQDAAERKVNDEKNKYLANNNESSKADMNNTTSAPLRRVGQGGMTIGNADCVKNNSNYVKESSIIITPKEKIKLSKASVYCNAHGTVTVQLSGKGIQKQITSNVNIGKSQLSLIELRTELQPGNQYTLKVIANNGVEIADLSDCLTEKSSEIIDSAFSNAIFQLVFNY